MNEIKSLENGSLLSNSEIVIGLILNGKQTHTSFSADKLGGKYGGVLQDIKAGKTEAELEVKYGITLLQSSKFAAQSVNGLGDNLDWVGVIDICHRSEVVQIEIDKAKRMLQGGEIEKASDILRRATTTLSVSQRLRSVTADEISDDYIPFMKLGSPVWDKHIGGIPPIGLVVIAAKTFTGKTTIAISAMNNFLELYKEKEILFVTLEDMTEGWKERARTILGNKSNEFWKRCRIMEFASSPDEIIQEASRHENVGMIVVDYVDYLAKNKDLESYENIYKTLSIGSKSLAVSSKFRSMPIITLAQFGKGAYNGGVPTLNSLMYTGEQYAYQICMLYHPDGDYYADNKDNGYELPSVKHRGYLVFWKVKNGCRPHLDEFPGAIQTNWSSKYGFDLNCDNSKWFSLTSETKRKSR